MRHMLTLTDWTGAEILGLLELARRVKADPAAFRAALAGKTLGMIFEKSSTRTRVSFEVGMYQLGGYALFLSKNDLQLGRGETIPDTARVLSRYLDAIMARVFKHQTVVDLTAGTVPIVNGLCDVYHPCQALADLLTVLEHKGRLEGLILTYLGDGNNVAHSLMIAGAKTGMTVRIGCPEGYEPDPAIAAMCNEAGPGEVEVLHDAVEATRGADVVYTDVWASMGQEDETALRKRIFMPYQVDGELFAQATPDALFMHCLPAHRGWEVTDEVVDHERSVVLDEAENRMHAQKALLLHLMGGCEI